ncbi:MAG: UDP-N-acetylglucosamine 1-carboxyvinyltransferase [Candidatus Cloacimonetes bacterium]|nr:UDP-N-acetylglucosamine 1-carboxyvinyltransferase [Candidatus Cloacimonadota bacterium]
MQNFIINGQKKLSGEVEISGAKNAILPIMAACLLASGKSTLNNVPYLNDIKMMAHLMRIIGARIDHTGNTMQIDATNCSFYEAPYELVSKMRASIYVLAPLLARFGEVKVSFPGGCAIGTRPVDLHLYAMEKLGAKIVFEHGYIIATAKKLKGNSIKFSKSSVGATANALMASVLAEGITDIYNAASEPEIGSLIDFLIKMGAKISGKDTTHLVIEGVNELYPVPMEMIPDRIEAGTFIIAGAITKSNIIIKKCIPQHLESFLTKIEQTGTKLLIKENSIEVIPTDKILPVNIKTEPYPLYPTDLQAQFMALMCFAEGESIIEETIFPDRFMHISELNRLEANISIDHNRASVMGVKTLSGAQVMATDLRASATLVLAGLAATGKTTISRIYHIDRGYEKIEEKLQKLGANIIREQG